jgi:hypothetical protein
MDTQHHPAPKTRIYGDEEWSGWWTYPLALLVATAIMIAAGAIITGTGQDGGTADAGSAAVGQTTPAAVGETNPAGTTP